MPLDAKRKEKLNKASAADDRVPEFVGRIQSLNPEWLHEQPPARQWLVRSQEGDHVEAYRPGWIARGELHLLAGEGGAGKGRFATQLALCAAAAAHPDSGTWFSSSMGLDVAKGDGRVLLLLGEDDAHEMHVRAHGVAMAERQPGRPGFTPPDIQAMTRDERIQWVSMRGHTFHLVDEREIGGIVLSDDAEGFRRWLDANGPWDLIAIDPLARFLGGLKEEDNAAMHAATAALEGFTEVDGNPAVIVTHHTRKPSKETRPGQPVTQHDVRGASAIVNAVRVTIMLTPQTSKALVHPGGLLWEGQKGEEPPANVREISEPIVRVDAAKMNIGKKPRSLSLAFAPEGGLRVESDEAKQERRRRQYERAPARENKTSKPAGGGIV